jgi:hypothetical protein
MLDFYSKHVVKNTFNYPCLPLIEDPLLVPLFVIIHRRFFGVIIIVINDLNAQNAFASRVAFIFVSNLCFSHMIMLIYQRKICGLCFHV